MTGNSGYFDDEKREFIIEDMYPKRPLINYLWSEQTVLKADQFGFGTSFCGIGTIRRELENGQRLIYIKDRETNEVYSPNRNYTKLKFDEFFARVGLGYHIVESLYNGIRTQFTLTVPVNGYTEQFRIKVKNESKKNKKFSLYFYLRPQANLTWHTSYGTGDYDKKIKGLYFPHFGFDLEHEYDCLYMGNSVEPDYFEVTDDRFLGVYGTYDNPDSLNAEHLSSKGTTFEDNYCSAVEYDLDLKAGEEKTFYFSFGTAKSYEDAVKDSNLYSEAESFNATLKEQKKINDFMCSRYQCKTPDKYFDSMTNIWLKRQLSLGKTWGRIGGKGFRDVMQDITAFVSFDTDLAKTRILYALKHQYINGNPIRMYEPDFTYPYYDGAAWVPATLLSYINETGDLSILSENVKYLDDDREEQVIMHLLRGLGFLLTERGKHNLVKWGGGDWNDSMNNCGMKGIGESVWLSIATVKAVKELNIILSRLGGYDDYIEKLKKEGEILRQAVVKYGFEDGYFIYGYNDYDEKVGAPCCEEGKIYLNPQTWAVLAGILPYDQLQKVMDKVEEKLKCYFGYVQCAPSYTKGTDKIGRSSYFVPGMVENGSVYIHGVTFKMVADCMLKRGQKAYETFNLVSPYNPENANSGMEPYAFSNMLIGPENPYRVGDAPMSWVTGSAGWMYRAMTEYLLGVQPDFEGLRVTPCMPDGWNDVVVKRRFREAEYTITFKRTGENSLTLDGVKLSDNLLPYEKGNHTVICTF